MIDKTGIYCDAPNCRASACNHYMSFRAKIRKAQNLGWIIRKINGKFIHHCPACPIPSKQKPKGDYWWNRD